MSKDGQLLSPARCTVEAALPEMSAVCWYHNHTVFQLHLWMISPQHGRVFRLLDFNSVWLQALNIAKAFTSAFEDEIGWLLLCFSLPLFLEQGLKSFVVESWDWRWFTKSMQIHLRPLKIQSLWCCLRFQFSFLDDDHRLLFNLHLTPSCCGALFWGVQESSGKKRNKESSDEAPIGTTTKSFFWLACLPKRAPQACFSETDTYLEVYSILGGLGTCTSLSYRWCVVTVTFPFCSSAVHEFPSDLFTTDERRKGAVALHILAVRKVVCFIFLL